MSELKLLFQGDSLTDSGRDRSFAGCNKGLGNGYVNLIASRILCDNPEVQIYNRGVAGNRIADMYARWIEDAENIPFNVISIMNGVNDVGFKLREKRGADANKFEFVYDRILYETKESHPECDIILCQPFVIKMIYEKENDIYEKWDVWSREIIERGEVVRALAKKYNVLFVEMIPEIEKALKKAPAEHWTVDCIHLTPAGNELIARTWLDAAKPILDKYL